MNGKKCLTVVLGNKVPLNELQETKYPRNIKFPSLGRSTKDRSSGAPSDEASAIVSRPKHKPTARSRSTTRKPYRKKDGKRPFKGKVKMLESSNEMSGSESDNSSFKLLA